MADAFDMGAHIARMQSMNLASQGSGSGGGGDSGGGGAAGSSLLQPLPDLRGFHAVKDMVNEMAAGGTLRSLPVFGCLASLGECGLLKDKEVNTGLKIPNPTPALAGPAGGIAPQKGGR